MLAHTLTMSSSVDDTRAADAMYALAFDMIQSARWRDASDVFRAMLLICPRDERGWLGIGQFHEEIGQSDVAKELYSLAVLVVPQAVRTRLALARLLRGEGRDWEADGVVDAAEEASAEDDELRQLVAMERRAS